MDDDERRKHADELAERLIERREKLNYFLATASIAVIAFSLKTALDSRRIFSGAGKVFVAWGCLLLLISAAGSLRVIRFRHSQAWTYIDRALYQDNRAGADQEMEQRQEGMRVTARAMSYLFILGMAGVAIGYVWAIAST